MGATTVALAHGRCHLTHLGQMAGRLKQKIFFIRY
jgi:hypothetical protein